MDYTTVGNTFPYSRCLTESAATKFNDTILPLLSSSIPCVNTVEQLPEGRLSCCVISQLCMTVDTVPPLKRKLHIRSARLPEPGSARVFFLTVPSHCP